MNDALQNILSRNSPRELSEPIPFGRNGTSLQSCIRAPDHAWQRPSRFIEVKGDGLKKLFIFKKFALENIEELRKKYLLNMKKPV